MKKTYLKTLIKVVLFSSILQVYSTQLIAQKAETVKHDLSNVTGLKLENIDFQSEIISIVEQTEVTIKSDPLNEDKTENVSIIASHSPTNVDAQTGDNQSSQSNLSRTLNAPSVIKSFDANDDGALGGYLNTMAISNAGRMMSLTEDMVNIYNSSGVLQFTKSLSFYFGLNQGEGSNPRVVYDEIYNRFVLMVEKEDTYWSTMTGNATIIIMVVNATTGATIRTVLTGNLKKITRTISYHTFFSEGKLACSKLDVFIGGAMKTPGLTIKQCVIYQIPKTTLYSLNSVKTHKVWWSELELLDNLSICPITYPNNGSHGPGIYLAGLSVFSPYGNNNLYFFDITKDYVDAPQLKVYSTTLPSFYDAISAPQKGTSMPLTIQGPEVNNGFYYDGIMHLVFNAAKEYRGSNCLFYVKINFNNRIFNSPLVTTKIISSTTSHYASATIAPSNNFFTDRSIICSFLASSALIYPSIYALAIYSNNNVSRIISVKDGTGPYLGLNNGQEQLWNTYTATASKPNDGSIWVAASYAKVATPYNKRLTRIAQLQLPPSANRIAEEGFNEELIIDDSQIEDGVRIASVRNTDAIVAHFISPNPAVDRFSLNFTLNEKQNVKTTIMDINGKTVQGPSQHEYPEGTNSIAFDKADLAKGFYYILLENNNGLLLKEKLVIE